MPKAPKTRPSHRSAHVPHLILEGPTPSIPPVPTPESIVTITLPITREVLDTLEALGNGSASHGLTHVVRAFATDHPDRVPKMRFRPPQELTNGQIDRSARDALIYHECIARTFTRKAIAKRYGLSEVRVHQIYAEQRRDPPPFPTKFTYATTADPDTPNLILEGIDATERDPMQALLSDWIENEFEPE